jgi:RNA polymerase sigma-70 factor, ECF subfamily
MDTMGNYRHLASPPSSDPDADAWLVRRARGGDLDAFEALVRRHQQRAYRIALRIVGNPEDAEDVTQEVFVQVWATMAGFVGSAAFSTWLYRVVVNRSLNHRRGRRPTEALPDGDHPDRAGTADTVIARERVAATARAVAALPGDLRAVFVLRQLEGLSYEEIGAILDLPEPTVRGRLARARKALVESLREWA